MKRREFVFRTFGVTVCASMAAGFASVARSVHHRIGMGTAIFRSRFRQTRPASAPEPTNPLTLLTVPAYYRERFGVRNLEFWARHFESLDKAYLLELRGRVKAAGARLINIQVDAAYDLASTDEDERQRSVATVRQWIDAAALLGSRAVRVNPGKAGGSVEKSILSLREVNSACLSKGLPLLTENHGGLEMDPDVHLRIREGAGPANIYTLPDFGNYPVESMWTSLAKILPYAYLISAKAIDFDEQGTHLSYDFDRCVRICERAGFKGIYSVEQTGGREQPIDHERIADWLLERVRANLQT